MRLNSYPIRRTLTSIAVILSLLALPGCSDAQEVVGFKDANDKTFFLHDFKGKPIVINLWATWCGPCVEEMPSLDNLQRDYAAKGLKVLAIAEDEHFDQAISFFKKNNLTSLTPYFDQGKTVYVALDAQGLPTTILVDANGQMIKTINGPVDWNSRPARDLIESLIRM